MIRVEGSGVRVPWLGLRVQGLGLRVLGSTPAAPVLPFFLSFFLRRLSARFWNEFGVWGLGFGVWGLGFGVWGLGFGVYGVRFRGVNQKTEVLGVWVQGLGVGG